jgi:hypothetical protein
LKRALELSVQKEDSEVSNTNVKNIHELSSDSGKDTKPNIKKSKRDNKS